MDGKKKVLLMGNSGAGKTSMRSIIFANYIAKDTSSLSATIDIESSQLRFLGNLTLNLWDCGGQEGFVQGYLNNQREHVFRSVSVLIFVFDIESREVEKEMAYFRHAMEAMQHYSPDAKVVCLLHKMDLLPQEAGDKIFHKREAELSKIALPMKVTCFKTSIWDETLYLAWSSIVYSLIPNINALENQLDQFCQTTEHDDVHRFEKISNIVKQFKLSCSKGGTQFQSMEVRNRNFTAFIEQFTGNTFAMVIMSDPSIQSPAISINIRAAKRYFEVFFQQR